MKFTDYYRLSEIICFREIIRNKRIQVKRSKSGEAQAEIVLDPYFSKRLPENVSRSYVMSQYVVGHVFDKGPKMIHLNSNQLEALENTSVNMELNDYNQPYPTMIIEYPENYQESRLIISQDDGVRLGYTPIWSKGKQIVTPPENENVPPDESKNPQEIAERLKDKRVDKLVEEAINKSDLDLITNCPVDPHHRDDSILKEKDALTDPNYNEGDLQLTIRPTWCIVHHDKEEKFIICVLVCKNMNDPNERIDSFTLITNHEDGRTIEDNINIANVQFNVHGSIQTLIMNMVRASINACLLFDEFGTHSFVRSSNDAYREKLINNLNKAKKRKDDAEKIERAEAMVETIPEIFTFNQRILLHKVEGVERNESLPTGRHVKPHWRRGYRRKQWEGSDRFGDRRFKYIRIPPVFVNKRYFGGEIGDTSTKYAIPKTYDMKGAESGRTQSQSPNGKGTPSSSGENTKCNDTVSTEQPESGGNNDSHT